MISPAVWRREGTSGAAARHSFLLAILIGLLSPAPGRAAIYSIAGFSDTAVVPGLSAPTAFTWTPDGRMLVLEKVGRVRIVVGGVLLATSALDISAAVDSGVEKGLLGICLDPGFAANGFVYLYYTNLVPQNRISRFTMSGNTLDPATESVILDHIDATNGNHNGGHIAIGPDGKLWAAPGDSGTGGAKSQNLSVGSFNGKVLRMELNGSPAAGNPFLADPTKEPRIWAYGFRNPFRFTFRPSNGSLYLADVGQTSREELDVVTAGGNYGWPMAEGFLGGCAGCIPPVFDYDRTVGQTIIGGIFVTGGSYPAFLRGKYVFGDYSSSWIRYLEFSAGNTVVGTLQDFATSAEGPVHFAMGPDGAIYYAAINTGKIYRINAPPGSLANRVFVSARSGNDGNACENVQTPCQTLAGALAELNADGEVILVESGGYGSVTITQGVTIEAPAGVTASIHPLSGDAVTINALSGKVTLRGLTLYAGTGNGITVNSVGTLNVENCFIMGFANDGIRMLSAGQLNVTGTDIEACSTGIEIANAGGAAQASVDHCHLDGNGNGYFARTTSPGSSTTTARYTTANNNDGNGWVCGSGSSGKDVLILEFCTGSENGGDGLAGSSTNAASAARYSNCIFANNGIYGVARLGAGIFETRGNNTITGNGSAPTFGTIGTFPPM